MALLRPETVAALGDVLGQVGSILQNPVDMSQAVGRTELLEKCFRLVAADPGVQQIVVQEEIDVVVSTYPLEAALDFNRFVRDRLLASGKPFVMVLPPGDAEPARLAVQQVFRGSGVPVFPGMDRAARALAIVARYGERHPEKAG
jgi:acyl-CoA synthetase (NDP forming)